MTVFEEYVAPARAGAPGLWRLGLGVAAALAAMVAATVLAALAARAAGATRLDDPLMLAAQLFGLAAVIPALALAVPALHGRRFGTLLAPEGGLARRGLGQGALLALGVTLLGGAPAWALGWIELSLAPHVYAGWAVIAILALLIPFQAAAEELMFRGYLTQELAARSRWPLIWLGIPTALFTIMHLGAPGAEAYLLPRVAGFGLFAAFLVWRVGGLAPAIGFHVVNNLLALLLFRSDLGVAGVGLLQVSTTRGADGKLLALELAVLALVAWRVPRRDRRLGHAA